MIWRELTDKEKRLIRMSVQKKCACYDPYYGCLPLDGDCYMTKIGFTNSSLCRYYEKVVLPDEPEILRILIRGSGDFKTCAYCGRPFLAFHNKKYCSDKCAHTAKKKATAARVRKFKKSHGR